MARRAVQGAAQAVVRSGRGLAVRQSAGHRHLAVCNAGVGPCGAGTLDPYALGAGFGGGGGAVSGAAAADLARRAGRSLRQARRSATVRNVLCARARHPQRRAAALAGHAGRATARSRTAARGADLDQPGGAARYPVCRRVPAHHLAAGRAAGAGAAGRDSAADPAGHAGAVAAGQVVAPGAGGIRAAQCRADGVDLPLRGHQGLAGRTALSPAMGADQPGQCRDRAPAAPYCRDAGAWRADGPATGLCWGADRGCLRHSRCQPVVWRGAGLLDPDQPHDCAAGPGSGAAGAHPGRKSGQERARCIDGAARRS